MEPESPADIRSSRSSSRADTPTCDPTERVIVLKIGSSSLSTPDGKHLSLSTVCTLVETVVALKRRGYGVILVTSGAVSIGCARMHMTERPRSLATKQAAAAIGQSRLMRVYDDFFSLVEQPIAQVLLTRENLGKSNHYYNALNTFQELLRLDVVPIVNENDTVAVERLRFGDNDTLSALVASLVQAEWLFLLTDVEALYTADPNKDENATPVRVVPHIDELKVEIGKAGSWGTGGMATKVQAARIGTAAGVRTVITLAERPGDVLKIIDGEALGTTFLPRERPIKGKKKWIAHGLLPAGRLHLDAGAAAAVLDKKSLFAAGIVRVEGEFQTQSSVSLIDPAGKEIARGLTNYASDDIELICGHSSKDYKALLGFHGPEEVVHRGLLVVLKEPPRSEEDSVLQGQDAPTVVDTC